MGWINDHPPRQIFHTNLHNGKEAITQVELEMIYRKILYRYSKERYLDFCDDKYHYSHQAK